MTINSSTDNDFLIIAPVGRLDSLASDELQEFIDAHFTDEFKLLQLDFSDVTYISSGGLRAIILIYRNLHGRKLKIVNANESVMEVFRLSEFDKHINID